MQADSHNDLDRTDELPRLDVAAYEASLGEAAADPLSRTDTWAVEALQSLELTGDGDEADSQPPTRIRGQQPVIAGSADLTVGVDRLLKRMTELETSMATVRTANAELERRCQSLDSDRAELEERVNGLQAENARLTGHSSISHERAQRLEQQLLDQFGQHNARLNAATAAREADRLSAERARVALEQQLERNAARIAELEDAHARVQAELNESSELAASRALEIARLRQSLAEEEDAAHGLGRNLAAKLADYDTLSSMVSHRDATILSLERARDELDQRLQQEIADSKVLATHMADAERRAAQNNEQFGELNREIEKRDQQLAQLNVQIMSLTADLRAVSLERDSSREALSQEQEQQEHIQQVLAVRAQEITALLDSLNAAETNVAALQGDLQAAAAARAALAARTAELESTSAELSCVRNEAAQIWTELEAHSALVRTREDELALARQTAVDLQSARDELQRALAEATDKIDRLYAVSRDDTLLTTRNTELAALKLKLEEQAPLIRSLEQSIRTRDTLIDDLRNEVRTVQDERAIMAGQIDKTRLRVKAMTQQIFQKDNRISTLKSDLAVHTEALAAIRRDINRVEGGTDELAEDHSERVLEPVDHEGEVIALNRRVMTIGRTNDNDIFISSKMISRHHARLLVGPNAVIVEDGGSTNGCFVNDHQVKQHLLREGDILTIGDLKFRLGIRSPGDTRMRANVISFNEGRSSSD